MRRTTAATLVLLLPSLCAAQSAPLRGARPGKVTQPGSKLTIESIDFDEFLAGRRLTELHTSAGSGPIGITAYNPFLPAGANAALAFDSARPTGGDFDLGTPHVFFGGPGRGAAGGSGPFRNDTPRGRVLIIAENLVDWNNDGLVDSPDDLNAAASDEGRIELDFSALGVVTLHGLTVLDIEPTEVPPVVRYYDAVGQEITSTVLPFTGDNGVAELDLPEVPNVRRMTLHMHGSGAIDSIRLSRPPQGELALVRDLVGVDVTPDGGTGAFFDPFSPDGDVYFFDTASGLLTLETTVGSPFRAFPTALSNTRRLSAIHGDPPQAGLWSEAGGWLDLGNVYPFGCGDDQGGAWDLTSDGNVAVGLLWNGCAAEAFRWTSASGLVPLQVLGESFPGSSAPPANRATKIAGNGTRIGGFAQRELVDRWPALWNPDGTGFLLPAGVFTPDSPGEILSLSPDGSMAAGIWNLEGFTWTAASGVVRLDPLPGALPGSQTFPNAITSGGTRIFGAVRPGFFDPQVAFVWTPTAGMRALADVVRAAGVTIPDGIQLENVLGASDDGSVLVGTASDLNTFRVYAFALELPTSAYGH